jgi:hypothetical protein
MDHSRDQSSSAESLFRQYWEYASALRGWFVIYGVGGIALFFTEPAAFERFPTPTKVTIILAFLLTVIAQVILAFTNKWVHWGNYRGAESAAFRETKSYKLARKLSNCVWIDLALDFVSLLSALTAICVLIYALAVSSHAAPAPGDANIPAHRLQITSSQGVLRHRLPYLRPQH